MSSVDSSSLQHLTGEDNTISQDLQTSTVVGWYILDANAQQIGPYTIAELRGHFSSGYLTENTFVWAEGRSDWQPLSSVPELMSGVYHHGVESLASEPTNNDDEFEKFQKEVKEVEAEVEDQTKGYVAGDLGDFDQERPSTPPEGEEEFTDDDGTTYKWDRSLRAWVPQETPESEDKGYKLEEMTFAVEEEVFPTLSVDVPEKEGDKSIIVAVEEKDSKLGGKRKELEQKNREKGSK